MQNKNNYKVINNKAFAWVYAGAEIQPLDYDEKEQRIEEPPKVAPVQ